MNERNARGKREIKHFEVFLLGADSLEPAFYTGMAYQFANVDVGIVEENIRVLMNMLQGLQEVMFDILIGMTAVDKGKIDFRQSKVLVGCKELVGPQLVVSDRFLDPELLEVFMHLPGLAPLVGLTALKRERRPHPKRTPQPRKCF